MRSCILATMTAPYSQAFFDEMDEPNLISARVVVPHTLAFFEEIPERVVDIGCGRGLWLKAFLEAGVGEIAGYDGDYVERDKLAIAQESFQAVDLEKTVSFKRPFDLAVSLEVAEHLPATSADALVDTLVAAAPVILFSAAIPLQGGSHHVNEQWPKYWEEKFTARRYVPVDCIRRHIWDDSRVSFFYQQNILMYVKESQLHRYPRLAAERASGHDRALPIVHPFLFTYYAERWRLLVPFLGILPPSALHLTKSLLKNVFRMPIAQLVRYLISGFTAAGTNLVALYLFVEFAGLHYLSASALALGIAIVVSFTLHKFFTFRERTLQRIPHQLARYLVLLGCTLAINTVLMWALVEGIGIPYLLAQVAVSGVIAVSNFFVYRLFVFRHPTFFQ